VTSDDPWLAATWPFVRAALPAAPCAVLDIGCGPQGGFVPALLDNGYEAVGVDPIAPDALHYQQVVFEELDVARRIDAVVASTSLHHVDDLDDVIERIADVLAPGGIVIVVEWAWELFDEATAQWCFARLASIGDADHPTWLHRHRDGWIASGRSWDAYFADWVADHGLHPARAIVGGLDERFARRRLTEGPYFFSELEHTPAEDEQSAIDAGLNRATGLRYVGAHRPGAG
jgi:SAM-dependent methyltransferase